MRNLLFAAASSAVMLAGAANAATVTFDEFAPMDDNGALASNLYAGLGLTIVATDDSSTWGGNSNGDPGNWDLEGTNGAAFAGFNGDSYGAIFQFAGLITNFRLDASRSNGSSEGQELTVEGWRNGGLITSNLQVLGAINDWTTFSLGGVYDEIRIQGSTGPGFSPFGIDNVNWDRSGGGVPEPGAWALMILGFASAGAALRRRPALV